MRKVLCLFATFAICLGMCWPISASETASTASFSDEECLDFLAQHSITIPDGFYVEEECISFVQYVLTTLEANPSATFVFNSKALIDFAAAIQNAYLEANNYSYLMPCDLVGSTSNILRYNQVVGSWSDSYENYNCYAYAIGHNEWIHPGELDWVAMGNEKEDYIYNETANVYTIANWICDDLESKGYTVDAMTSTMPSTTVNSHKRLICVRKDQDTKDFHLMKLESDGYWYHKPGESNPLRYTSILSSSYVWIQEAYFKINGVNLYLTDTDMTYESLIYFISYSLPHDYEYSYYGMIDGAHYHIRTCTGCDATTGSAIACFYKGSSSNCMVCGHNQNAIASARIMDFEKIAN